MADRYLPALSGFELTADEQAAVEAALLTANPWEWSPGGAQTASLAAIKVKIREYHLQRHEESCCYCRRSLEGEFNLVIDREHVLPKSTPAYRPLTYTMWNLGVACKRCNMQYKGMKTDFVVSPGVAAEYENEANYRIVHPNFDLYEEHLDRSAVAKGTKRIVKYSVVPGSAKGAYTYEYFNLRGLEIGSFDALQTGQAEPDLGDLAMKVQLLAKQYGQ